MNKVTVIGSANIDLVVRVARMPAHGETVLGHEFLTVFGGKGANEAVAAARLGAEVSLVACLGADDFGNGYIANLRQEKVNVSLVKQRAEAPTGCALITLHDGGDNTIVVCPGANGLVSPGLVQAAEARVSDSDVVLVQYEIPEESVREVIRMANRLAVPVIVNVSPVPRRVEFGGDLVDFLVLNEVETEAITGVPATDEMSLPAAAARLHKLGVRTVILTRGAEETYVSGPDLQTFVPTFEVEPVDTVGAGDTFAGALAAGLAKGQALEQAVRFANAAAALATTMVGAQTSMPTREKLEAFAHPHKPHEAERSA